MHVVATRLLVNVQNNNVLQADMHLSPACSCHHLSLLFLYLRSINLDGVILMVIKLSHTKHHVHVTTLMQECVRFNMKGQWLQRHREEASFLFVRVRSEKIRLLFLHLVFILLHFSLILFFFGTHLMNEELSICKINDTKRISINMRKRWINILIVEGLV